ncbi:metal-sensitive transcriptional regulator [Desulfallas thermosapovorans]|uniref:DNA-binding FrmR family transcriptional regulator n=1 Tax=Desulfallas thermosapovorans DSM 6562 TaxID=1121431 RepID=A0A5S4ZN54_9FIRM|nr:metal-sensitive transcriptional regulator [Desulfallas thermosapovorans]TYO93277.1 DNA-binding FrmR family transcriptional regulator [Desulfallas thermosapovorans DSM 6562]
MRAKQNHAHKKNGTGHNNHNDQEHFNQEIAAGQSGINDILVNGPDPNALLERDPTTIKEVLSRLKKIEGQVRGVQKMVQDYRSCGDIVIQLAAIKAAINRVGITMLGCHLADHIKNDLDQGRDIKKSLSEFMDIFKKFS